LKNADFSNPACYLPPIPARQAALNSSATKSRKRRQFAFVAALAVGVGLGLWQTPLGDFWLNASYDYLFRFGARAVTNRVEVVLMDNAAYDTFHQERGQPWDRALHARLLDKLADDGCALVVVDSIFRRAQDPAKDDALAAAMRRLKVVLMAEQAAVRHSAFEGARPVLPAEPFLSAASNHWGVAWLDTDLDLVVRRHWPFPAPGPYPSLPWVAAHLAGAKLDAIPRRQWLRYYGSGDPWPSLSYEFALAQPPNYYRDKIVFIGLNPKTSLPGDELDEFRVPYTRWTNESKGGVQLMVTAFLNLVNGEWLVRPPWWCELVALIASGVLLAGAVVCLRPRWAGAAVAGFAGLTALLSIAASHYGNFWFPWLVISGAQVPVTLAALLGLTQSLKRAPAAPVEKEVLPQTPGYELTPPAFGKGAYGRVWLARDRSGRWRALKAVYLANFGGDVGPYEREFNGIKRYQALSGKHPGLLQVEFVSAKLTAGYFYYVMELGDSLTPDWEKNPASYVPRDLVNERAHVRGHKLPVRDCLRIGIALAEALEFLHRQGFTHRDIKPQNVIFVQGRPKLADFGLVAEIRPSDQQRTYVGTPGYMPPPPELPGTTQADVYALGMMLFVLSTGRSPVFFPEIATTLAVSADMADYVKLNTVILKACEPDCKLRFASAAELHQALQAAAARLGI
jgi:CHASE2 domain-containing sensor protein